MHMLRTATKSIAIAFSMFSAIPMPQFAWDKDSMRFMLIAFPLVGLVIGLLAVGCAQLSVTLGLSSLVRALALTALPLLVTGGIHLDGFCDTWDARASHREPERMRLILKDPHIGAFGVMHLALLLLATFVLWAELPSVPPTCLVLGYVLSRSLSGLSVAAFPLAPHDGLARSFAEASDRTIVRWGCALIATATSAVLATTGGWSTVIAAALAFAWYRFVVVRQFGGLSGDLCGWYVQTSELWMLASLYIVQCLEAIL